MNLWLPIGILAVASLFGFYWRSQQGKLKAPPKSANKALNSVSNEELNKIVRAKSSFIVNSDLNDQHQLQLGKSVTLLQFSTAFCSPCKATAQIISHLVEGMDDVVYIQVASEENLKLVEKFDVKTTPTVIFFNREGIEVGRAVGIPTKEQVAISINAVRTPSDDVGL
ncbi:MAG: thioredoxin family protein [Candidatus Nanopelagicaceae bacterium]